MLSQKLHTEIDNELEEIFDEISPSWIRLALAINKVEESGFWQNQHRSFTKWLESYSITISLSESTLWRCRRAAKYYPKLFDKLSAHQIKIPQLKDLSPYIVSAENIDILAKLERVMPDEAFIQLAQKVVSEKVPREELRQTWVIYRELLEGKTARGLGTAIPRVNRSDPMKVYETQEAQVLKVLTESKGAWLKNQDSSVAELFIHVKPEEIAGKIQIEIDAVAFVKASHKSSMEFHGIDVKTHFFAVMKSHYEYMSILDLYCDYSWIAFPDYNPEINAEVLPRHIGLLSVEGNQIRVIRQAQRGEDSGTRVLQLAKGLLLKVARQ